jgi:hypothetical protein
MSRNYRGIVITVVGLISVALGYTSYQLYQASQQQYAQYHYQPAREQGRLLIAPGKGHSTGFKPYCGSPQDHENSDLCAQWAAVDQITESNRLTSINLRLSIFTALLTLAGTMFVGWTLLETVSTSRRELRGYLFLDGIVLGVANKGPAKGTPGGVITIKNFGQTPVYDVLHFGVIDLVETRNPILTPIPVQLENVSATAIPAGGTITAVRGIGRRLTRVEAREIRTGALTFVARGRIEYRDTFGRPRWTTYHYFYSGIWPPSEHMLMSIANTGNCSDQNGAEYKHKL